MTSKNNSATVTHLGTDNWLGAQAITPGVRIHLTEETAARIDVFRELTGLHRSQFAVSTFGYPMIPKPVPRFTGETYRLAPENVANSFLGHPIYWIDPQLTEQQPEESEEAWAVRMFYLIDALGMWDEDANFIDYLDVNGYSFAEEQINSYHYVNDRKCESDDYPLLDKSDFRVSVEDLDEMYVEAMSRIAEIQTIETERLWLQQVQAYKIAKIVIGDDERNWSLEYNSDGSQWNTRFEGGLRKLAEVYNDRARKGDPKHSDITDPTIQLADQLKTMVASFHECASILDLPVRASLIQGRAHISFLASVMRAADHADNQRWETFAVIDKAIEESLGGGITGVGGYDPIIRAMRDVYREGWDRLRLALINYDNYREDKPVYATTQEMIIGLQEESGEMSAFSQVGDVDGAFVTGRSFDYPREITLDDLLSNS